jgi:hypothetical protein
MPPVSDSEDLREAENNGTFREFSLEGKGDTINP